MITRTVYYRLYKPNPNASALVALAFLATLNMIREQIPGIVACHFGAPCGDPSRPVVNNDYDAALSIVFSTVADLKAYEVHPLHLAWVRNILNGYILEGSTANDKVAEFIRTIMVGDSNRKWIRNPEVPDSEVVWAGEEVRQFGG